MTAPWLAPGRRVRLLHDVDRYPHFVAPAGSAGVVSEADEDTLCVRMDELLPGAEEWDNEIVWSIRDGDLPERDLTPEYEDSPFVNYAALQAASEEELREIVEAGGPMALIDAAGRELATRRRDAEASEARGAASSDGIDDGSEPEERAEQERAYEIASADVVLPLSLAEARTLAEALDFAARQVSALRVRGYDDVPPASPEELRRLAELVRLHGSPAEEEALGGD